MLEIHVSADNVSTPIAAMENRHLRNFLMKALNALKEVKLAMDASADTKATNQIFNRALYGVKTVTPQEAAIIIKNRMKELYPYFAEVYLRDDESFDEVRDLLREVMDRSTGVMIPNSTHLLKG